VPNPYDVGPGRVPPRHPGGIGPGRVPPRGPGDPGPGSVYRRPYDVGPGHVPPRNPGDPGPDNPPLLRPDPRRMLRHKRQSSQRHPTPRFDGLYVRPLGDGAKFQYQYLRFFSAGKACSVSGDLSAHDIIKLLLLHSGYPEGDYSLMHNIIEMRLKSSQGVIERSGTISADSMELLLYSHSYINGHSSVAVWRFEEC
jgi:hypothetical protein